MDGAILALIGVEVPGKAHAGQLSLDEGLLARIDQAAARAGQPARGSSGASAARDAAREIGSRAHRVEGDDAAAGFLERSGRGVENERDHPMKVLRIGVAPYEHMKARAMAIARGELTPGPDEPKLWFPSIESLARVLSDKNRALIDLVIERRPNRSPNWNGFRGGRGRTCRAP